MACRGKKVIPSVTPHYPFGKPEALANPIHTMIRTPKVIIPRKP